MSLISNAGQLAEVLLDSALKGALVLALAWLVTSCMRHRSAAARHLVWSLAVASLLLLPLLCWALPGWHILPHWMGVQQKPLPAVRAAAVEPQPEHRAEAAPQPLPPTETAFEASVIPRPAEDSPAQRDTIPTASTPARSQIPGASTAPFNLWHTAWVAWLVGVSLALLPTVGGMLSLWRLERRSRRETSFTWLNLLRQLLAGLRLSRSVRLLKSARRRMPMTWGIWRPRVLLPEERRRVVLLHELAHAKRWDYMTQLAAQLACALHWFNPLVWLAARQMVTEREQACDDIVLSHGAKPAHYAEQVLEIAVGVPLGRLAAFGGIAMARPSKLEGRLLAILDYKRNRLVLTRTIVIGALAVFGAVLIPVSMIKADSGNSRGEVTAELPKSEVRSANSVASDAAQWGEPVEGFRVRLHAPTAAERGDSTPRLLVDIANQGPRRFHCTTDYYLWQLEVDGSWYVPTDFMDTDPLINSLQPLPDRIVTMNPPGRFMEETSGALSGGALLEVVLGRPWTNFPLVLNAAWRTADSNEVGTARLGGAGIWYSRGVKPERLKLTPGKHAVRLAVLGAPMFAGSGGPVRALSQPVEVEVRTNALEGVGPNATTNLGAVRRVAPNAAPERSNSAESQPIVDISGRLVDDETGEAIGNVSNFCLQVGWRNPNKAHEDEVVWRQSYQGPIATKSMGRFVVPVQKMAQVWRVLAVGYLTQTLPVQAAETDPQSREVIVRLKRAGDQRGVVLDNSGRPVAEFVSGLVVDDETGEPIADFVVQSSTPNPVKPEDVFWNHHMMGNKQRPGRFGLPRPTPQRAWRILAPGHVPLILAEQSIPTTSSASDMEIRLKRGGGLQGVVLDDGGRPVAGARVLLATVQRVFLMDGKFQYGPFKGSSTTTDGAGRFALRGEGGASEKVVIVSPDSHLVWPAVQSEPGQEMRITLPRPGTLIVRYDIPGDSPEAKPEMWLTTTNKEMPLWQNISFGQSLTVTNQGQTVLTNLTPGTYRFRRWKSADREHGAETEHQTVLVEASQTQQLDMVRTNGQRVRGQVIGLDQALASGGYILVRTAEATGQPWPQRSRNYSKEFEFPTFDVSEFGADGTFQTAMLKPGNYTVIANVDPPKDPAASMPYRNKNPDYLGVAKVTVTAEDMLPVKINLAPALFVDIAGSAVDDETSAPIPDLMIQTGKVNPDIPDEIIWDQGFRGAAEGGRFSLWNERDGAAFRFLANGYLPQVFTRNEIIASRHTANLQVRLKRGGELHGVVLDHAGRPVAGATVYLAPLDLGYVRIGWVMSSGSITNWAHSFATTDAVGRFSLRGVGGNQTRIIAVSADGQLVQPLQVSGPGQELKITLPKPASLIVHYDIPGDVSEAYVGLTLRTNELEMPLWKYVTLKPAAKVRNGGQVVLTNLTPGTYDFSRSRFCGTTNGFYAFMFGDPSKLAQSDFQTIVLEPGQTEEVSLVRSVGQCVQGRVTGLESITNTAASYLYVGSATAIRSPLDFKTQLEPCFDAVSLAKDGQFQTALLEPGTYTLVAEVYVLGKLPGPTPVADDEPDYGGWFRMRPSSLAYVGSTKVTVTTNTAPPVKIQLLPWKPTADPPARRPGGSRREEVPSS